MLGREFYLVCNTNETPVLTRFPPAFIALLADLVIAQCPVCHDLTQPSCKQDPSPHPMQSYPMWVRYGILWQPTLTEIVAGWDASELRVLKEDGDRFSPRVFAYWRTNRQSKYVTEVEE